MTPEGINLLTKVLLETATPEDFFAVSDNPIMLMGLFESARDLLSSWNLDLYSGDNFFDDNFFDIDSLASTTADHIYRVSYNQKSVIMYISYRKERIYTIPRELLE